MSEPQNTGTSVASFDADETRASDTYRKLVAAIGDSRTIRRAVTRAIRHRYGHATLPSFHDNGGEAATKIAFYEECIAAIKSNTLRALGSPSEDELLLTSTPPPNSATTEPTTNTSAACIPPIDKTFHIERDVKKLIAAVLAASAQRPQNLLFVGPAGCGKTSGAIQLAAIGKRRMLVMDCANVREARDWFGHRCAESGTVYWKDSQFVESVTAGWHVIVLDEITRVSGAVKNTLFPMLDERRETYVEERRQHVKVGPGTIFVATMNEGANFSGAEQLDDALSDRFSRRVEVGYLSKDREVKVLIERTGIEERIASILVDIGDAIRKKGQGFGGTLTKTVSTRRLVDAALDFKVMGTAALEYTITNHFSSEGGASSERSQVMQMLQGKFPPGTV